VRDTVGYTYGNTYAHTNANANSYGHSYSNTDANPHSDANAITDASSITYTKNSPDPEESTHAPAAPVAFVDEKETPCAIRFLESARFDRTSCLRSCGLFNGKRSAARHGG
jgi:hypothetical protein